MITQYHKIALAAAFGLALAFTISCHDGGNDDPGTSSTGGVASGGSSSSVTNGAGGSSSGRSSSSVTNGTGGSSSSGRSSSSVNISVGDSSGTFKDNRDGQTYKWVKIGEQKWMAQNLNYFEPWVGPTRGNKCYDNKDANCEIYGRLYEWDDAIRICPDGWHLPAKAEWDALIRAAGSDAGKKLKSASNEWGNGAGTDIYGFGALPGGYLDGSQFRNLNIEGIWRVSTESSNTVSPIKIMNSGNGVNEDNSSSKTRQFSVRCVEGYSSSSAIAYGEFTDNRDNQKYVTVKIGAQTWMAQDLNYAGTTPQIGSCYDNKTENCNIYGRLYDWATAMNISKDYNSTRLNSSSGQHKGICPDGWHLPTRAEWDALISSVGESAGKKLKARSSEWGDNYGTDIYGFRGLPGGSDDYDLGGFANLNIGGNWWTSTESLRGDLDRSHMKSIVNVNVDEYYGTKAKQYSVRCIKD